MELNIMMKDGGVGMRKIVVAMDSMKGCLDSLSASRALANGLRKAYGSAEMVCVPVADGGEGTAVALSNGNERYRRMTSKVLGPLGTEIEAEWYYEEARSTAFIDMASGAGLALIDKTERNPLNATTYGVGQLITDAVRNGTRKILLGLGGSATNDAGLGACQAMGLRILDKAGQEMPIPFMGRMLGAVGDFKKSGFIAENYGIELFLLCDVTAPFTGEKGASRIFSPQKGASPEEVKVLESGMENVRRIIFDKTGIDLNLYPGSGAAGGTAGGLMVFAGGEIRRGAPMILDAICFDRLIDGADLIITGEGSSDSQTLMGKLPFEILQRGKRKNIPVWLVAGRIADEEKLMEAGFERVVCINEPEIVERSGTVGLDPMEAGVAERRLEESL